VAAIAETANAIDPIINDKVSLIATSRGYQARRASAHSLFAAKTIENRIVYNLKHV
jgi:hypothetical protein